MVHVTPANLKGRLACPLLAAALGQKLGGDINPGQPIFSQLAACSLCVGDAASVGDGRYLPPPLEHACQRVSWKMAACCGAAGM